MIKKLLPLLLLLVSLQGLAQSIPSYKIEQLDRLIRDSKTPLVINFWATYCKPCVEEIPYFQSIVKKYENKNVRLLLISLDLESYYPSSIEKFARRNQFTAPIIWLNESNADHFCPVIDSSWSGVIPATLFYNPATGYRKFYEVQMKPEAFEAALKEMTAK
jgi:peroxiredoxin